MLIWDAESPAERVRRAELDLIAAARAVAYWRGRGQLTVEHLDELELVESTYTAELREYLNPTPPASVGEQLAPCDSVSGA